MYAAHRVVKQCVKPKRIEAFREEFANAFVLPVSGANALPMALAQEVGLEVWDKIIRTDKVKRKELPAIKRLQHKPIFTGIIKYDAQYVIIDDIVTQGGTITALRKYILSNGGKVAAIMALAYAIGSYNISPTKDKYVRLFLKFEL